MLDNIIILLIVGFLIWVTNAAIGLPLPLIFTVLGVAAVVGAVNAALGLPSPRDIPKNFRPKKPESSPGRPLLLHTTPLVLTDGGERCDCGQRVLQLWKLSRAPKEGRCP